MRPKKEVLELLKEMDTLRAKDDFFSLVKYHVLRQRLLTEHGVNLIMYENGTEEEITYQ